MFSLLPSPKLPQTAIEKILSNLTPEFRIYCRLISTDFAKAFLKPSKLLEDLIYKVDGSSETNFKDSRLTLMNSSVPWTHLCFTEIHLDRDFLKDENRFTQFVKFKALHIQSLTFFKCKLQLGRFIELVVFCVQLKKLRVENCPSLYKCGWEIRRWARLFNKFGERLSNLQALELIEEDSDILNGNTLLAWLPETKRLERLEITTASHNNENSTGQEQKFPTEAILKAIQNNKETLESLELSGKENNFWTKMVQGQIIPYKLYHLKVDSLSLDGFEGVVNKLPFLETLSLVSVSVGKKDTNFVHEIINLREIYLKNCTLESGALYKNFAKCEALEVISLIDNTLKIDKEQGDEYNDDSILEEYVAFFLENQSNITEVTLSGKGIAKVIEGISKFKTLEELNLSGTGFSEESLRPLFDLRETLQTLNLSNTDITDEIFMNSKFLLCMNALETLNIEETEIGDTSAEFTIMEMPNLKNVYLKGTQVTAEIGFALMAREIPFDVLDLPEFDPSELDSSELDPFEGFGDFNKGDDDDDFNMDFYS